MSSGLVHAIGALAGQANQGHFCTWHSACVEAHALCTASKKTFLALSWDSVIFGLVALDVHQPDD